MCECPNICRVVPTAGLEGRQPEDGLRMHPAYGCVNAGTVTIRVKCPEGCKDQLRKICVPCLEQYRRWISTWEFLECIGCHRFYDLRDYWILPKPGELSV